MGWKRRTGTATIEEEPRQARMADRAELAARVREIARDVSATTPGTTDRFALFGRLRPIDAAELVRRMREYIVLN